MAARYLLILISCMLVVHASMDPAFADGAGAPDAIPLSPPGQTMGAGPPAQPLSRQPWRHPDQADKESRWYGHHVLLVDGIGYGLIFLGLAGGGEGVVYLGTATMLLGAPVVHGAHGEGINALLSLPLHVLLPIGGTALSLHLKDCSSPPCDGPDFERMLIGAALGVATASIIDAAFIARTRPKRRDTQAAAWVPQVGVTENGFSAGIGGWF
jgi:hypothetical protein